MELKFGDVQETALIPLAIKVSETSRPALTCSVTASLQDICWQSCILRSLRSTGVIMMQ